MSEAACPRCSTPETGEIVLHPGRACPLERVLAVVAFTGPRALWGGRRGSIQVGSPEDREYEITREMVENPPPDLPFEITPAGPDWWKYMPLAEEPGGPDRVEFGG